MNFLVRFLIASVLLLTVDVRTSMSEVLESQIKTAYVLNFVKFTDWPSGVSADGKVNLCVVGNNVLDGKLASLDGRKAENHEIHVVQYSSESVFARNLNAERVRGKCQVLFIGESEQRRYLHIIKALGDAPVLTISDIDDFAENGGCIGLRYRENKIVFEVNLGAVQRSKLRLPGQLLNLASFVFRN